MSLWDAVQTFGKISAVAGLGNIFRPSQGTSDSFFGRTAQALGKNIGGSKAATLPESPDAAYIGSTNIARISDMRSRQIATEMERLMSPRNNAMSTGVDALASSWIRNAIAASNKISNYDLDSYSSSVGSPTITLGSETLKV